jgi:hypothetical protein
LQANISEAASENGGWGDLFMSRTASEKTELAQACKKRSTYRRIVTGNINWKAVVQSDEPFLAYQLKTVPR